jgi:RHS repeat-associated protein
MTIRLRYYYEGSTRVAMRTGSSTLNFLLGDHLGSNAITTNSSGVKSAEIRYYPWGTTRYTSGTSPTTFQYTGQRVESSLGLLFYNARWYDPALARFIQADTEVPGGVQGLDRYAYNYNNPINYIDPDGRDPVYVNGYDASYLFIQSGNTCAIAGTAVGVSILTGQKYTQADIQPIYFHTYIGIGVMPLEQSIGNNMIFPGKIEATFTQGTRADLIANVYNGCPTIVNITLTGSGYAHALLVIGYDPQKDELLFFDPQLGKEIYEDEVKDRYDNKRGFKSFEELWADSKPFIPNNSMVTLSISEDTPIGIPSIADTSLQIGGFGGGGVGMICMI